MTDLDRILLIIAAWIGLGAVALTVRHRTRVVAHGLFPASAVLSLCVAAEALRALGGPAQMTVLPLGLPGLPFHFRLDSLSALFVATIGFVSAGTSIFSAGYVRPGEGTPPGLQCLQYHLFLASMGLVVLADDAYVFMIAWEAMALSSFFLVIANHRVAAIRRAGYLYLLLAHVGAVAILLCFGVLQANTGDFTFDNLRAQSLSPFWASTAFLLAVLGFGAKAGIVPMHVWLPEAHPAAPSPVSALMSGVMLKAAVYAMLRVAFDLLHGPIWWWGALMLGLGLLTAMFGVVYTTVQTDVKRLLAYSSIENLGLIFVSAGLALMLRSYGMNALAALALTATLFHVAAHAVFKSLLFLATGTVLHATGERNLGRLGGLIRYTPWVAWLTLVGALAASGLPPLGGFVSEWLLLQSILFTTNLPGSFLNMLVPLVAAAVALVAALSGYAMVKFYGVVFLGQPREDKLREAHDASSFERVGLSWLAAGCAALGLFPVQVIDAIDHVTRQLVDYGLADTVDANGWLLLAPTSVQRASYSPVVFLLVVCASIALAAIVVRILYHGRQRTAPPWDCGFAAQTSRMQDTAEGFGQPIRQIFEPFFRMRRELPSPFDARPRYRVVIEDHFWHWIYVPTQGLVDRLARLAGGVQRGRISIYLLYSFVTLVVMLLLMAR
jgi:formate hydrogenlyase subunit 3/multisubunit Na+/H+ antiporter MnhD subunit